MIECVVAAATGGLILGVWHVVYTWGHGGCSKMWRTFPRQRRDLYMNSLADFIVAFSVGFYCTLLATAVSKVTFDLFRMF